MPRAHDINDQIRTPVTISNKEQGKNKKEKT